MNTKEQNCTNQANGLSNTNMTSFLNSPFLFSKLIMLITWIIYLIYYPTLSFWFVIGAIGFFIVNILLTFITLLIKEWLAAKISAKQNTEQIAQTKNTEQTKNAEPTKNTTVI